VDSNEELSLNLRMATLLILRAMTIFLSLCPTHEAQPCIQRKNNVRIRYVPVPRIPAANIAARRARL